MWYVPEVQLCWTCWDNLRRIWTGIHRLITPPCSRTAARGRLGTYQHGPVHPSACCVRPSPIAGADPGFGHRGGEGRKRQRSQIEYDAYICNISSHGNCISTSVLRKLLKQNIFDSCNLDLFYHIFSAQGLTVEAMGLKKAIYMFYSFSSIFPRRRIAKLT
jgi:hypothetical protein